MGGFLDLSLRVFACASHIKKSNETTDMAQNKLNATQNNSSDADENADDADKEYFCGNFRWFYGFWTPPPP